MDTDRQQPVLFLDKVFLRPRKQNLRGVELFNLSLIRDMARQGIKLRVPIHYSWQDDLDRGVTSSPPESCKMTGRSTLLNGLQAVWRLRHWCLCHWHLRRQMPQKIILANVANGLIPALCLMRALWPRMEIILFAHRMPSRRFMFFLPKKTTRVLAVNHIIAACFQKAGFADAEVFFGHINAGKFHPAAAGGPGVQGGEQKKVNFWVVGFLDNAWKGADTAIAAFRAMPAEISADCVLHLASYRARPSFPDQNIVAYGWFPDAEIPDWLRRMDIMIVPSRDEHVMRETFSLAMIEGMLTGLPVIASNLPILREKLKEGGGYVFNNIEELAKLMVLLATRPELRLELGRQARRIAQERYVWNTKLFISRYLVR